MDMTGLGRTGANSTALTPLTFLSRAVAVYPDRTAIVYGDTPGAPQGPPTWFVRSTRG